jgi:hypothetical protein
MNILILEKKYKELDKIGEFYDAKYQPRVNNPEIRRHIYFEEIKSDFIKELNTYGFSPFILSKISYIIIN